MKDKGKGKTVFNLNCLDPSHLQVNRDIVSGLKYVQHTYRTGVKGKGPTHYSPKLGSPLILKLLLINNFSHRVI